MAWATPVNILSDRQDSLVTSWSPAAFSANAGETIFGWVNLSVTSTISTMTDSVGNTYVVRPVYTWGTGGRLYFFYVANPSAVAAGTISFTFSSNTRVQIVVGQAAGGDLTSPLGTEAAGQTNASNAGMTGPIATGPLGTSNELIIGASAIAAGTTTFTESAGFTSLTPTTGAGNGDLRWAYQIASSSASVDYQTAWTPARQYGADVVTLKVAAAPAGPASGGTALMMGIG